MGGNYEKSHNEFNKSYIMIINVYCILQFVEAFGQTESVAAVTMGLVGDWSAGKLK
jgi:hypothetical protein